MTGIIAAAALTLAAVPGTATAADTAPPPSTSKDVLNDPSDWPWLTPKPS